MPPEADSSAPPSNSGAQSGSGPPSNPGTQSQASGSRRKRRSKKLKQVVERKLMIFEEEVEEETPCYLGYPGVTLVTDYEGVIEAFRKIDDYLKPLYRKPDREIFVSFGGFEMNRNGFISLIAITDGFGYTYIFDVISLENVLWDNGMRKFLEVPYNEKVVFNTRNIKDCLFHNHEILLKGIFDLRIVEILQRGKQKTYAHLPHTDIIRDGIKKSVVDKKYLFTMDEMFVYYIKDSEDVAYIKENVSEKTWRSRKGDVDKSCIKWMVQYQKFVIKLWKNFEFGDERKDKLLWISSEIYNNMFFDKEIRTYDIYEENDYQPQNVLCFITHDQPLGGVECTKCLRMLPSSEFSNKMLLDRPTCKCTICNEIPSTGVKSRKTPMRIKLKKTKKKKKKKKKKKTKKVRIEGEEDDESGSGSSSDSNSDNEENKDTDKDEDKEDNKDGEGEEESK